MKIGIVGLPNVGKSTFFNALTKHNAKMGRYPFTTVEPNLADVEIPDKRLEVLKNVFNPKRVVPTSIKFLDVAGLVEGASQGEGLGNKFLAQIRDTDAIVHIVRCFENQNVAHIDETISPKRDIEIVNLELILADLSTVEKSLEKAKIASKSGKKEEIKRVELLTRIRDFLQKDNPVRDLKLKNDELKIIKELNLLTQKPVIYVANVDEDYYKNNKGEEYIREVREIVRMYNAELIIMTAKILQELSELSEENAKEFAKEMEIPYEGLNNFVRASYKLLDIITFFTGNENEVHAWTVKRGTPLIKAAGKIHSDMEKGFIKGEVINWKILSDSGSVAKGKEMGLYRAGGKDYTVEDGDVIYIHFLS